MVRELGYFTAAPNEAPCLSVRLAMISACSVGWPKETTLELAGDALLRLESEQTMGYLDAFGANTFRTDTQGQHVVAPWQSRRGHRSRNASNGSKAIATVGAAGAVMTAAGVLLLATGKQDVWLWFSTAYFALITILYARRWWQLRTSGRR